MSTIKKDKGRKGEDIAVNYFLNKGFFIFIRNFYSRLGEIDIIVNKNDLLVFVEVKYYSKFNWSYPSFSITEKKKISMIRTAEYFFLKNNLTEDAYHCQFDLIITNDTEVIDHLENIFNLSE